MDINKLTNNINGPLDSASSANSSQNASKIESAKEADKFSDKVSLEQFGARKSEKLFAQIELEKLNQNSFSKLKAYKAKLVEYEAAKSKSDEAAAETEIGKLLNNPDVWSDIANKISD